MLGDDTQEISLPCDGCTACCRGEQLVVLFSDDDSRLLDRAVLKPNDTWIGWLRHNLNGDCAWLEAGRCAAYEFRPKVCRAFSCVGLWFGMPAGERLKMLRESLGVDEIYLAAVRLHRLGF